MNKISLPIIILVFCMCIALFPQTGSATLSALNETEMRNTTGQAGIVITASDIVNLDVEIGHTAFGDSDGTGDGVGAFLSMNDIAMNAVVTMSEPVSVSITTESNPFTNTVVTGVNVTMSDVEIAMSNFSIGSITVGSEIGSGKSFGSFSISDYRAKVSGNIRIWAN